MSDFKIGDRVRLIGLDDVTGTVASTTNKYNGRFRIQLDQEHNNMDEVWLWPEQVEPRPLEAADYVGKRVRYTAYANGKYPYATWVDKVIAVDDNLLILSVNGWESVTGREARIVIPISDVIEIVE